MEGKNGGGEDCLIDKGIGVELEAFETSVVDDLGAILVVSKHIAVRTQAMK